MNGCVYNKPWRRAALWATLSVGSRGALFPHIWSHPTYLTGDMPSLTPIYQLAKMAC